MPRRSMNDLLADTAAETAAPEVSFPRPPAAAEDSAEGASPPQADQAETEARSPAIPQPRPRSTSAPARRTPKVPKYRTLERKEALVRTDQLDALTALRRRLNRRRGAGVGERITENTLIRVAVDLLLTNADHLAGTTEEELRESVTARLR